MDKDWEHVSDDFKMQQKGRWKNYVVHLKIWNKKKLMTKLGKKIMKKKELIRYIFRIKKKKTKNNITRKVAQQIS